MTSFTGELGGLHCHEVVHQQVPGDGAADGDGCHHGSGVVSDDGSVLLISVLFVFISKH